MFTKFCLICGIFIFKAFAGGPSLNPSLVEILESSWYSEGSSNGTFWECSFECEDKTKKPVPNPAHKATSNGCGIGNLKIPKQILPDSRIEDCCNQHDICYDTCNSKKSDCDDAFKTCMHNVCGNRDGCNWVANRLYDIVHLGGCPAYLNAQKDACLC